MTINVLSGNQIALIKKITNGRNLDLIGLLIVISGSIFLDYHKTRYYFSMDNISYYFPLGFFSIINVGFSMIATRLVTKKNNLGNLIHTFNTTLSGTIDYLLGNIGAILTYPISIVANYLSYNHWKKDNRLNDIDFAFYRNLVVGMITSLILNFIAFYYLSPKKIDWLLFMSIAFPAGLTFGGTFNNIKRYPDNWFLWQVYNLSKIIQSIFILNIANTIKYSFYMINAILGYITWNDDKIKQL